MINYNRKRRFYKFYKYNTAFTMNNCFHLWYIYKNKVKIGLTQMKENTCVHTSHAHTFKQSYIGVPCRRLCAVSDSHHIWPSKCTSVCQTWYLYLKVYSHRYPRVCVPSYFLQTYVCVLIWWTLVSSFPDIIDFQLK